MTSSPTYYQPIPSDESANRTATKQTPRFSACKGLLLALAFCLVAFGSYKVGQWSVIQGNPSTGQPISDQETSSNPKEQSDQVVAEPSVNSTHMPGKYSVG